MKMWDRFDKWTEDENISRATRTLGIIGVCCAAFVIMIALFVGVIGGLVWIFCVLGENAIVGLACAGCFAGLFTMIYRSLTPQRKD